MPPPKFDWITLDCYGTLIDWERGISDAFAAEAARDGRTIDRKSLLEAYHAIEPAVEAKSYRRYRDVLRVTAERVAAHFGWTIPQERAGFLAESLPSWPPFPDTNPALARLAAAGVKLGILSNVDDDLLAGSRRHLRVEFDLIVTAKRSARTSPGTGTSQQLAHACRKERAGSTLRRVIFTMWFPARRSASPSPGSTEGGSGRAQPELRIMSSPI